MSKVTREHRAALFKAIGWEPNNDGERSWIETGGGHIGRGLEYQTHINGYEFGAIAQAIADAEQHGAERELAAVVRYLGERGWAFPDIEAGKHREEE